MAAQYLSASHAALTVGLLNLVVGCIGADAAPDTLIERTLWPQRANHGFGTNSLLKSAFLLSAGGPLHQIAIKALDNFSRHSLHTGAGRGHMLGTAFFPDTGFTYKLHRGKGQSVEQEWVRNGLLVRILKCTPYIQSTPTGGEDTERRMRQRITVSQLELFYAENVPSQGAITLNNDHTTTRIFLAIIMSELPAILFTTIVTILWSTTKASVFLIPLALKLFAAATTIKREDPTVSSHKQHLTTDKSTIDTKFEIHIPGEGFQVISGPSELVLSFFRHFGHPVRCRWREICQIITVVMIGASYPLTFAVTLFMPLQVQALWATYQAYLVCAMLIARFAGGDVWCTTEELVARALVGSEKHGKDGFVLLKDQTGCMVGARLMRTVHGSYTDGKKQVARIVEH